MNAFVASAAGRRGFLPTTPLAFRGAGFTPGRRAMGQNSPWVEVRPNVNLNPNIDVKAPINIELGALPLSLGLFTGAAVAFLARTSLPKGWPQTTAALVGAALAVGGIGNLLYKKVVPPNTPPPGPLSTNPATSSPVIPPTSASGQSVVTSTYAPPTEDVVTQIAGHISYPSEGDTISLFPWQSAYTVRVDLRNPTAAPVTIDLVIEAMEDPTSNAEKEKTSSNSVQVTIPPGGDVKSVDVPMVSQAWGFFVPYVDVTINAKKRAWAGAPTYMIDSRSFVIK